MNCSMKVIATFILLTLVSFPAVSDAETLRAGYFMHPPHHYKTDKGVVRGATVAYFSMVAQKMGFDIEWVGPLPFSRMLAMLKRGELEIYPHAIRNPEWEEFLYFPDQHYHYAQPVLAVKKNSPLDKVETINDIRSYKIDWHKNIPASPFIKNNTRHLKLYIIPNQKKIWEMFLLRVVKGYSDGAHDLNAFTLRFVANRLGIEDKIKIIELPDSPVEVVVAISKKYPRGKQLMESYNRVQRSMQFDHEDYIKLINSEFF